MSHRLVEFVSFGSIPTDQITAHMRDPRLAEHMPLLGTSWDHAKTDAFLAAKAEYWRRDGLGHWAILVDGEYVGWGGFQREGSEWDFGLVLRPAFFGLGFLITREALNFAREHPDIPYITFLLPHSRKHLGALRREGAVEQGQIEYEGKVFRKFRLETA